MAKVIGFKDKPSCRCKGCGAIVEYKKSERLVGYHHHYDGSSDRVYYIICPSCGDDIDNC